MTRKLLFIDSSKNFYVEDLQLETEVLGSDTQTQYVKGIQSVSKEQLQEADTIVVCHGNAITREHLSLVKNCRGIVTATAGFDHIDIAAAAEHGIPVCNIPDYGSEDVADHTMLLLLACARRLTSAMGSVAQGEWNWHSARGAKTLRGKTLGLVGLGRIGNTVASRAKVFGLEVTYFDPFVSSASYRKVGSLATLVAESDFVSLHCPLDSSTTHLIGASEIALLKPGAVLINTARGGLIEQNALVAALSKGRLGAVGLDVLENEPSVPTPLRTDPKVLLTPHMAFYSEEGLREKRVLAANAAKNFLDGRNSQNSIVNLHLGRLNAFK